VFNEVKKMKTLNLLDLSFVHGGCDDCEEVQAATEQTDATVDVVAVVEAIVNPADVQEVVDQV
jgi:hypothetical protein